MQLEKGSNKQIGVFFFLKKGLINNGLKLSAIPQNTNAKSPVRATAWGDNGGKISRRGVDVLGRHRVAEFVFRNVSSRLMKKGIAR